MQVIADKIGDREITTIALPVVSQETCAELGEMITELNRPVLVAFDEDRWSWTTDDEERDLVQMIRAGEFDKLKGHLAGSSIARRFANYKGVGLDSEFVTAHHAATTANLAFIIADRDQTVTFQRAWRLTPFSQRASLLAWFSGGLVRRRFDKTCDEQRTTELIEAERAGLSAMSAHEQLVEENAGWLASQAREFNDDLTVILRPHMTRAFWAAADENRPVSPDQEIVPKMSWVSRALPWIFSVAIITAFVLGFVFGNFEKMEHAVWAWIIINGTLAGVGTIIAGGHLITVICTALSAPLVSLNPAVGAGMVGAFVQALVRPPTLRDIQNVGDDVADWRGWWSNRLARLILIFILANLFSTIGSFAALAWFPPL